MYYTTFRMSRAARRGLVAACLLLALVVGLSARAFAQGAPFDPAKDLGIDQRLGSKVALDAEFRDESGKTVRLADYLGKKPILLMCVFYHCQGVCTQELIEVAKTLKAVKSISIGDQFDIVTVSIHPKETPDLAKSTKAEYVKYYNRPTGDAGWHFLTGNWDSIQRLTGSVGFRFTYDPVKDLIRHPAGIMVVTPEGRLSKYFYGIQYPSTLLRDALVDAGSHKIGAKSEPILLGCLQLDPATGRVTMNVVRALKVSGVATVLILAASILAMSLRNQRRPLTPADTIGMGERH